MSSRTPNSPPPPPNFNDGEESAKGITNDLRAEHGALLRELGIDLDSTDDEVMYLQPDGTYSATPPEISIADNEKKYAETGKTRAELLAAELEARAGEAELRKGMLEELKDRLGRRRENEEKPQRSVLDEVIKEETYLDKTLATKIEEAEEKEKLKPWRVNAINSTVMPVIHDYLRAVYAALKENTPGTQALLEYKREKYQAELRALAMKLKYAKGITDEERLKIQRDFEKETDKRLRQIQASFAEPLPKRESQKDIEVFASREFSRMFQNARKKYIELLKSESPDFALLKSAEREYIDTRNTLLVAAIRFYQSRAPLQKDGTRGDAYLRIRESLFNEFVVQERMALSEKLDVDTGYSFIQDPLLFEEFHTLLFDFMQGDKDHEYVFKRRELMQMVLNPEDLVDETSQNSDALLDEDEKRKLLRMQQMVDARPENIQGLLDKTEQEELRRARRAYAASQIARADGNPYQNEKEIGLAYRALLEKAYEKIRAIQVPEGDSKDWVTDYLVNAQHSEEAFDTYLREQLLSPEKQKRFSKLKEALSKMKWGRQTFIAIAALGVLSSDTSSVDVTPMRSGPTTYDTGGTSGTTESERIRPVQPTVPPTLFENNRILEEGQEITISIERGGTALSAIQKVRDAAGRVPWITPWLQKETRSEARLSNDEQLAIALGFMTDYIVPINGRYEPISETVLPGSALVITNEGLTFRYPDGREHQLVNGDMLETHPLPEK